MEENIFSGDRAMSGSSGSDSQARVLFGILWILWSTVVEQMYVHTHLVGGHNLATLCPWVVIRRPPKDGYWERAEEEPQHCWGMELFRNEEWCYIFGAGCPTSI